MKSAILLAAMSVALAGQSQQSTRIYASADPVKGGYNWTSIRLLNNGEDQLILNNQKASGIVIDAQRQEKQADFKPGSGVLQPMTTGVAAMAFDIKHNRLYFATMFTRQLRYINLGEKSMDRYYQAADLATALKESGNTKVSPEFQGPVITRMAIGADGNGYGLSNDGNSFFRFSLGKKTVVEELGALVDDQANGKISVHNSCSGWGGDMVAADNGDLYLFTMRQEVFKINTLTRVATYMGKIEGLSDNFTVNGAAVDADGSIVLSTATFSGTRARIADIVSLKATEEKDANFYNASDLASANLIRTGIQPLAKEVRTPAIYEPGITAYPNPVVDGGNTVLQFNKVGTGRFTIDMLSSSGSNVQRKSVQVTSEGQLVTLSTRGISKGFYIVRATDANTKDVYTTKIVVQ
jgi:hypothetical protein